MSAGKQDGKNELLFREVNDRIKTLNDGMDVYGPSDFLCECAHLDCAQTVSVTLAEYEAIRAVETQFLLRSGHEQTEIERVVRRGDGYVVVEKSVSSLAGNLAGDVTRA